jgi:hypothetical protein
MISFSAVTPLPPACPQIHSALPKAHPAKYPFFATLLMLTETIKSCTQKEAFGSLVSLSNGYLFDIVYLIPQSLLNSGDGQVKAMARNLCF